MIGKSLFRAATLALSIFFLGFLPAWGDEPTAPAGMTQEQFDELVDAISKSVAEKLKAEGVVEPAAQPAAPAAAKPAAKGGKGTPAPKPQIVRTPLKEGPSEVSVFLHRAGTVLTSYPVLFERLGAFAGILRQQLPDGRGPLQFLLFLGIIGAIAVAVESVVTWPRGAKSIYFRDPDGNLAELISPGFWATF